nr:unnamed protein product [Spirometra erinaceieuropaei]
MLTAPFRSIPAKSPSRRSLTPVCATLDVLGSYICTVGSRRKLTNHRTGGKGQKERARSGYPIGLLTFGLLPP